MKLFWKRYLKKDVGLERDAILGIPKGRKLKFVCHKDTVQSRYKFISYPMDLKEYVKGIEDVDYVKTQGSKIERSIILYGYVSGRNIVMTEEIEFLKDKDTLPEIHPLLLRSVKEGDIVDLKISKEYKFDVSTDAGLGEYEFDAVDMEMSLPDHVIDSESSLIFKPDFINGGYGFGPGTGNHF